MSAVGREVCDDVLGLCARATGNEAQRTRLAQAAAQYQGWHDLADRATKLGLGPMAHLHLKGLSLPAETARILQAVYVRERSRATVRQQAMRSILQLLGKSGIDALVLKGAALSQLVYPEPALRPMGDADLLVPADKADAAHMLLQREMGFTIKVEGRPTHHLQLLGMQVDGTSVYVEIHNLLGNTPRPVTFEQLAPRAMAFDFAGVEARTLSREDMLWHVYRHAFSGGLWASKYLFHPLGMADLVSILERWSELLDWTALNPAMLRALAMLHWVTPLDSAVRERLAVAARPPAGILRMFDGFPTRHGWKRGWLTELREMLLPSEWWLRLRFGPPRGRLGHGLVLARHAVNVVANIASYRQRPL